MKKAEIMNRVRGTFGRMGLKLKKHSPEILIVVGVIGTVASAVMACKATTKLNDILEKAKEDVNTIHECMENECVVPDASKPEEIVEYTEEDGKKDLTIVYVQTGIKLVRLYAPAVALGALSLASVLTSNNILRKRNVALAAAYTAVDKSFKEYRSRVVDRFGDEVDRQLKYNIKAQEVEETVVDEESGEEKVIKKTVQVSDIGEYSEFARFFDELSPYWEKDADYNLMFVRAQQQYANDLLRSRGHVFLNEVYDMLGIPRTKAGQIVGWVYDPKHPNGDNYIDFGMYETYRLRDGQIVDGQDFLNGTERSILLDFNVDGNVLDLI